MESWLGEGGAASLDGSWAPWGGKAAAPRRPGAARIVLVKVLRYFTAGTTRRRPCNRIL